MTYGLDSSASNADRVVLRRSRWINFAMHAMSLGVGLPMGIAGLVALAFLPSAHPAPITLLGAGLFVAALGQLVSTQFRAPRRLIFDNARAQLLIDETGRNDDHAAILPFEAIEGFRWLPHAALSGAGHGSPSAVVEMTKHNGAVWTLSLLPSVAEAEALTALLLGRLDLQQPATPSRPHEPKLVRIEQNGDDTTLSWKRRYSIAQSALLFAASAGLAMVVFGTRVLVSSALHYGVLGCTTLLAVLALYALLDAALRSRKVVITSDRLHANCRVGRIGNVRVPLHEIDAVVFHFAPSQRDMLFVLRADERLRLMALTRGKVSLEDALAARAMSSKLARIEVGDLTMPEKLNLEQLLRRLIHERTGRVIH